MRFEGRGLTEKEKTHVLKLAPAGTILIVFGFMEWHGVGHKCKWCTCLRFFDNNDNVLKVIPYR